MGIKKKDYPQFCYLKNNQLAFKGISFKKYKFMY